jgi:hypothetical protein
MMTVEERALRHAQFECLVSDAESADATIAARARREATVLLEKDRAVMHWLQQRNREIVAEMEKILREHGGRRLNRVPLTILRRGVRGRESHARQPGHRRPRSRRGPPDDGDGAGPPHAGRRRRWPL